MILPLLATLLQTADSAGMPRPVRLEIAVRPETVTVGGSFLVTVTLRAPRGSVLRFPAGPDSTAAVEGRGPPEVRVSQDPQLAEQTAFYRMVAWGTGWQVAGLGDALVSAGGVEHRVPLAAAGVYVRSVLPTQTGNPVARPARDILSPPHRWWPWLAAAALLLAPLGLLRWWRRRRGERPAAPGPAGVSPLQRATEEFRRIEALGLLDAGAPKQFVALFIEALRRFLAARVRDAALSHTTTQLLEAMRTDGRVTLTRLAPLLGAADLVKFAHQPATAAQARELALEVHAVLADIERAVATGPDPRQGP